MIYSEKEFANTPKLMEKVAIQFNNKVVVPPSRQKLGNHKEIFLLKSG